MKLKKNALGNCLKARERGRFIPVSCKHNSYLSWKSHYDRLLDREKKGSSDTGQDDSEIMLSAFNIGLSVELHLHSKLDRNRSYFLTSAHRFSSLSRVLPLPSPSPFPFPLPSFPPSLPSLPFFPSPFSKVVYCQTRQLMRKIFLIILYSVPLAWHPDRVFSFLFHMLASRKKKRKVFFLTGGMHL